MFGDIHAGGSDDDETAFISGSDGMDLTGKQEFGLILFRFVDEKLHKLFSFSALKQNSAVLLNLGLDAMFFQILNHIIRAELRYFFGNLNDENDISAGDMLDMLVENNGSFQSTSAYLSIKVVDGVPFVILNACHCFLAKWEDRDIADIIQLQLLNIKAGLISWSYPESISLFSKGRN